MSAPLPTAMPIDTLGKLFFPSQQRWQRRRRVQTILLVILLTMIVCGGFVAIAVWQSSQP